MDDESDPFIPTDRQTFHAPTCMHLVSLRHFADHVQREGLGDPDAQAEHDPSQGA